MSVLGGFVVFDTIIVLILLVIVIYLLIAQLNITSFFTNNVSILALNANKVYLNSINLLYKVDFMLINNSLIQGVNVANDNNLLDIEQYLGSDLSAYSTYFRFFACYKDSESVIVGITTSMELPNAFTYVSDSIIAIAMLINDVCYCFTGSINSTQTDVLALIEYISTKYSKFIIAGSITIDYTSNLLHSTESNYKIISNINVTNIQSEILSYDIPSAIYASIIV